MHSCSAGNYVELSQYLNGLSTNLQVMTALRNQLKTVQTLKLNQRRLVDSCSNFQRAL